jgi:hypothetical protein
VCLTQRGDGQKKDEECAMKTQGDH